VRGQRKLYFTNELENRRNGSPRVHFKAKVY
jgi:hypothetical protein